MQNKRAFNDDFTFEVNEKVVSIVAKETGFQGIQPQALDVFSSLLDSCKTIFLWCDICFNLK